MVQPRLLRLNLQYFAGEKTEKATPKKRLDSRKKGQVAKSADVNTAIILLLVFLSFLFIGTHLRDRSLGILKMTFQDYLLIDFSSASLHTIFVTMAFEAAILIAPIMAVALAAGVLANYLQVGFLFSTQAIQPKLEKIDPIKGFKRIFSIRAIVELCKSLLKITFVGAVTFGVIWFQLDQILRLPHLKVSQAAVFLGKLTVQMGLFASAALLFLSLLDYLYQKYDFEKNIRMSKQDIKDEYKKTEGDPLIKSKIKQKQREVAMRRMMQDVPKADVIITNPTHFAIALKYDDAKMDAPYVVAKGVDFVAQKIKQTANEHSVAMVENRPLARAMYDQVEIGSAIPEEYFKAVAEILAYVYSMDQKAERL
ncbi:flagellar biosynthesis protein FlhB [Bacillus lacus]|uniref:Flagellar biosynthetic protein FlhB n=1 Tax=Metabacillus lacus TaxID=1983721 RepID=A0A7X2LYF7_9BACI|nr:flagellar biosynthesis protein FlhB [Metabacillus lacus]MRX70609.1 flagellar biosynthesis protein FlhB [Metabacillus lacus]